jgi:hypothetical protein
MAGNARIPRDFVRCRVREKRLSRVVGLAEGEELSSNPLCVRFQRLSITYHRRNCRRIADSPRYPGGAGCAACKAVFDPDLEQGGNTNIVVRRDPATGNMTRVVVHRRCRTGRSPRSASSPEHHGPETISSPWWIQRIWKAPMMAAILGFMPWLERRLSMAIRSGTAAKIVPRPATKPKTSERWNRGRAGSLCR